MSAIQVRLATQLLSEYFGQIVANVGASMMSLGSSVLNLIAHHSKETISNCKKAVAILIQHQIVDIKNDRGFFEYAIKTERILLTLRYPKYIYVAKVLHGAPGEQIVEKILKDGMLTYNEIVKKATPDLTESSDNLPDLLHDTFVNMAKAKLLVPCCLFNTRTNQTDWNPKGDEDEDISKPKYLPERPLKGEPTTKRRREEDDELVVYWTINVDPFHTILRDMMITESLTTHYGDDIAAQLVEVLLRSGANANFKETLMVSKTEIEKSCLNGLFKSKEELSTYLLFLTDDANGFVTLTEERAGVPMYRVNTFKIIDKLVRLFLCSAVVDRFGPKAGRIFNLLLNRKLLMPKQIEEIAMIDPKESRECTNTLFRNRFIKIMQFPPQNDYLQSKDSKGCYLYGTEPDEVCRSTIERCYQAIFNCIVRRNHENHTHKSLIDRKIFIDAVITNLKLQPEPQSGLDEQIEELNQSFSSHDRELLEKLKNLSFTLEMCELKIDETLFLMQTWLDMNMFD